MEGQDGGVLGFWSEGGWAVADADAGCGDLNALLDCCPPPLSSRGC